ncbi:DNA polymerase III alpha subunit [Planococcus halocryophilus Or1]|uniref:DNA-directed DNA polymerase n=1 Tax=Planococcus halocryophilus TaxID=1215089 RepID=A0A1C7DNC9_9BACL|nr:DNA polymerase III subunit alpha [Planococcus halocryophilus]ANU12723.1 DNA polymerase III subunit alpha [Planococcus halocryophilus]EMF47082.1 DNA polymerase III alpha subunit [Planococcus halocryophilus Or1]
MSMVYPHISTSADLLKSTVRLDELFPFLKEQGATSVAIVNTKLYGILPFWEACRRADIHGVIGLSVFIEYEEQHFPVVLYAQTNKGYDNLLKISSALSTRDKEAIPEQWLKAYREGLICIIPNKAEWLMTDRSLVVEYIKNLFGKAAFGSVERPGGVVSPYESAFIELCEKIEIPIIASHEIRYMHQQDAFAYEVASAIGQGVKMNDPERQKPEHTNAYVPSQQEFLSWFEDRNEWIQQTADVLKSCGVTIPMNRQLLPVYPLSEQMDKATYIAQLCKVGLEERVPDFSKKYQERLNYELSIIAKMGFIDYFLIVADFMKYAKDQDIMTGPGRGSSASSLVAYSLKITDVDPIEHGLLFERFLNPERITLPDIDIDFADHRRHEVVEYVAQKYGAVRTAQIITFGTLSAKAVARDTARVFGFEAEELEAISKLISNRPGTTLRSALKESTKFNDWIIEREERKSWFKTALKLEGLPRHASTHAAGVILSPTPLVNHVPIEKGHEGIYLTQWPMQELEAIGLLKMDFLGLRNLTILEQIRSLIYWDTKKRFHYSSIPLEDAKTFKLLATGDTTGVFQLESDGMRHALQQIQPTAFGDIVAVNALYRPGPMEFIPLYARRKHGQETVKYVHPILEPILRETYGVIVYQEQIMHIAAKMAGFSLGEADLLRRAVSKKKREILDEEREHFVQGAKAKGFTEAEAAEVYDLIVRFADYGFPKSHAVAYSMISYQLSYMKAHYPVYFYTSLLTNSAGNAEKTKQLMQEIKEKKIPLLPPSVQKSRHTFSVEDGQIRFGLNAVKGVPGSTIKALLTAREEGPFKSLFNIAERISALHFNRKSFEPLIKAGALDEFGHDRGVVLASLDSAIKHAELVKPNDEPGLFDDMGASFMKPKYTKASEMPESLKLEFEKEVLGFYLSKHPIEREKENRQKSYDALKSLKSKRDRELVKVLGVIEDIKRIRTKKGDAMAFLTLMDETGPASVTLFPVEYAKFNLLLEPHATLEIQGLVENRNHKTAIICKNIET